MLGRRIIPIYSIAEEDRVRPSVGVCMVRRPGPEYCALVWVGVSVCERVSV